MINLLPPELKSGYRFARTNVILRKWVVMFLIALVGLGAIGTYGMLAIHESSNNYSKQIAQSEATFKKENYTGVQKRVEDISGSFKLVVKVLEQEILFSKLIQQIGAAIPNGANLTSLNINQSQSAIDISANAETYADATQVQVNLADPKNKIFSKADIVNITCISKNAPSTSTAAANTRYPCTVTIRALFATNNTYLLINNKAAKATP